MPSSDKVLISSVAKAATRELPNKGAGIVNMSQGASGLPKDKGPTPTTDPGKAVVTKRQHSDTPSSPGYPNVYVRRKVESEHNKVNSSQELKGNGREKTKEQEPALQGVQHDEVSKSQHEVNKPHGDEVNKSNNDEVSKPQHDEVSRTQHEEVSKPQHEEVSKPQHKELSKPQHEEVSKPQHEEVSKPHHVEVKKPQLASPIAVSVEVKLVPSSSEKPDVETVPEKTDPRAACDTVVEDDTEQSSIQYWNERFNRLQTYLENCDRSTQEGYLRKLRSLSATGRSMHAIELEKRAIHLLMEEGKELQRMKALNVLGKVSPNATSKQTPLQRQLQK